MHTINTNDTQTITTIITVVKFESLCFDVILTKVGWIVGSSVGSTDAYIDVQHNTRVTGKDIITVVPSIPTARATSDGYKDKCKNIKMV